MGQNGIYDGINHQYPWRRISLLLPSYVCFAPIASGIPLSIPLPKRSYAMGAANGMNGAESCLPGS